MVPTGPNATSAEESRSWQRYRLIADTSTDVVYETDTNGVIQWISTSVHELLDWRPEQLLGRPAQELFHPLDLERMAAILATVYLDGHPHDEVPCMVRAATGGYRAVTIRARPLLDADLNVSGAVVTMGDTHDKDSALRALATLSRANRALVRETDETALLQHMCDTVVHTGRYLFSWYGRPVDDPEQSVQPMAKSGDHQGYLDEIRVSWGKGPLGQGPTGRCLRMRQTQVENDFTPDPEYRPWLGAATRRGFRCSISLPVIVDGAVDGALMVYAAEPGTFDALAQDLLEDLAADLGYGLERLRGVQDLKCATRKAQDQQERVQAILDSQFDPFILLEAVRDESGQIVDLRYVEVNAAAVEYNRLSREQMIGTRLLDLFPGQLEHGPARLYFRAIETGEPVVLDDYSYGHEIIGEERRYDIRAVKSGDAVALTWRDVTNRHVAAQRIADSERRYRLLAENATDVILLADQATRIKWSSPSAIQAFGLTPDDLIGHAATEFIHPDDVAAVALEVDRSTVEDVAVRVRFRWRCGDGTYRWFEAIGRPVDDDGSGQAGRVVSLRDIETQVRTEQELAAREQRYRLLAENASDVVWQVAPDGTLAWTSPSVTQVLGWRAEQLVGRLATDLIHEQDRERAVSGRADIVAGRSMEGTGEFRLLQANGSARWMAMTVRPIPTPVGIVRVIAMRDIEDEVTSRRRLEFALGHDQATGLPNRQSMLDRIGFLRSVLGRGHVIAVLCIGIDALSEINEALTHAAGDIVLTTVAARIAAAVEHPDMVGRGSGDEFLVMLPDLPSAAAASALAEGVRVGVYGSVTVAGQQIEPTVSIGIAIGDQDSDAEQLLRDASLALRKAKNNGRDRCEFADAGLAVEAHHRISLEAEIRDGLRDCQFVPWFQPIVFLPTGRLAGYEALARWVRPDGIIEPRGFLPVAEHTSLINDIDITVLRQSVATLARLPEPLFVSINVAAATLSRTPYAELVAEALGAHQANPARLHIEITETLLLELAPSVVDAMEQLADLGVAWYVDDFGTGYSSISHLRDLPVSGLKLDQSFTSGMGNGEVTSRQLADALIGLANGLGLDSVAEGVETQAEADYLRMLGWRHGQGWLYGKAAPFPDRD